MWRRLLFPVVTALAVTAVLAVAQSGSPYEIPEPAVTASKTLRLPAVRRCVKRTVRLNLLPPTGASFASLSVRVDADEILQLAGLAGPGSLKVVLPSGRSRVRVSGTTSGGQFVQAGQTYRRCVRTAGRRPATPKPRPKPTPTPPPDDPTVTGGGED